MATIVEGDHAPAGLAQGGDPTGMDPVHLPVRRKAVDEHNRLSRALVEKCDLDPVVRKALHEPDGGRLSTARARPQRALKRQHGMLAKAGTAVRLRIGTAP